jgi:hypothetical protein
MFLFYAMGLKSVPCLKKHSCPHICYGQELRPTLIVQSIPTTGGKPQCHHAGEHLWPYLLAMFDVLDEFWSSCH